MESEDQGLGVLLGFLEGMVVNDMYLLKRVAKSYLERLWKERVGLARRWLCENEGRGKHSIIYKVVHK